jgi:hypothetical protein
MKHLRRRWLLVTPLFAFSATVAEADEYYQFFSIDCNEELSTLTIEMVGLWNIRDAVWPLLRSPETGEVELPLTREVRAREWQAHEASLERLETQRGLYVFGEPYGRYTEAPVVCRLQDTIVIDVTAPKLEREPHVEGDVAEFYRGLPTVTLKDYGSVRAVWVLTYRDKLTIRVRESDYDFVLESCRAGFECNPPCCLLP